MPNTIFTAQSFSDDLSRVIQASRTGESVRACLLTTRDREYAFSLVKQVARVAGQPLHHFTIAARRTFDQQAAAWRTVNENGEEFSAVLRQAGALPEGAVVVVEDGLVHLRDDGGDTRSRMLLARFLSPETRSPGLVLVFLEPPMSEGRLPATLAEQFVRLDVPYPRAEELEVIAREELAAAFHREGRLDRIDTVRGESARLAPGVVGLTRSAARDTVRDALALDARDLDAACARLEARKARHLQRELAMNVLDTSDVEEPVGLDHLVEFLDMTRGKMRVAGPGRARGVLLVGPPGTGKTMLARAVGRMVDLPVVEFRLSALMSSLLGASEQNFARAFATLEAMSPNVVFIDEIEKAFGDSSERDGGTMMRCTGSLLSWLSDNPYPNFIVATSNSLTRMGEIGYTMTRSERFDAAFFVDVPCHAARRTMLGRWLAGRIQDAEGVAERLAARTAKFSGADLRSVVKLATAKAEHDRRALTLGALEAEAERKRVRAEAIYGEFERLRQWGSRHCDPAGPTDA
jgi:hypothetical protein